MLIKHTPNEWIPQPAGSSTVNLQPLFPSLQPRPTRLYSSASLLSILPEPADDWALWWGLGSLPPDSKIKAKLNSLTSAKSILSNTTCSDLVTQRKPVLQDPAPDRRSPPSVHIRIIFRLRSYGPQRLPSLHLQPDAQRRSGPSPSSHHKTATLLHQESKTPAPV